MRHQQQRGARRRLLQHLQQGVGGRRVHLVGASTMTTRRPPSVALRTGSRQNAYFAQRGSRARNCPPQSFLSRSLSVVPRPAARSRKTPARPRQQRRATGWSGAMSSVSAPAGRAEEARPPLPPGWPEESARSARQASPCRCPGPVMSQAWCSRPRHRPREKPLRPAPARRGSRLARVRRALDAVGFGQVVAQAACAVTAASTSAATGPSGRSPSITTRPPHSRASCEKARAHARLQVRPRRISNRSSPPPRARPRGPARPAGSMSIRRVRSGSRPIIRSCSASTACRRSARRAPLIDPRAVGEAVADHIMPAASAGRIVRSR